MKPDVVTPVYKSIVRWMTDIIEELNATGLYQPMTYHDWENRGDENKLPQTTLAGLDAFTFDEGKGLWVIRFAFGLSSYRDQNLINEIELIGALFQRMGEGEKIPLREMVAGEQVNELLISDWKLMPMAQSNLRNYRTMAMTALRTGTD